MVAIVQVVHHVIGLALKTYIVICTCPVAVAYIFKQPLDDIPQVKEHYEHFTLLDSVYILVVEIFRHERAVLFPGKDKPEKIYGTKVSGRQYVIVYYLHFFFPVKLMSLTLVVDGELVSSRILLTMGANCDSMTGVSSSAAASRN